MNKMIIQSMLLGLFVDSSIFKICKLIKYNILQLNLKEIKHYLNKYRQKLSISAT